jgi:NAD(P)-dependent dehydrogenase (short-subunit alcohol dehydrogenase family)
VATALHAFGQLDILVNNAGVNFVRPTLEVTDDDWDRVLTVDQRGTFLFCQEALRHMTARRTGSIINVSSVHARASLPGAAPYAAAKGGVSAMTRALAGEFGPLGIRVNAVCPGLTATEIWRDIVAASPDPGAVEQHWRDHIALDRLQESEEVAAVILFLASDESSYITGSDLYTDGGMTAMLTQRERGVDRMSP